jgi:hypothetical protein
MNRFPSRPSRSARRNADIWTVRLACSTNKLGQTRVINSCLLTNSRCRSSKTISICRARLPRGTDLSPSSRRNCAGSKRNGPNKISLLAASAGLLPFLNNRWSVSGLWMARVPSNSESEWNGTSAGASANDKRLEGAIDPDADWMVSRIAGDFTNAFIAVVIVGFPCLPVCSFPRLRPDLASEGVAVSTAPAVVLTALAGAASRVRGMIGTVLNAMCNVLLSPFRTRTAHIVQLGPIVIKQTSLQCPPALDELRQTGRWESDRSDRS